MEKAVEAYLRKCVKAAGGLALKLVSPGQTGVPDRLILMPGGAGVLRGDKGLREKAPVETAAGA